ncbi:hypothetical protein [Flavobacterium cyclinae]|uniref:hypothetical protein n=1 Tax=Flavobacterium cyclinae TaxID=2895947 RepID=UPI001E5B478C|nr:hypothetical protein [Flavobacterium cyclinae]UGS19807.1 hypothetical protein LOS86_07185 [Flavobacterium cyclinae]
MSFVKSESPLAVSQSRAILTADIIFEGQVIKYDNTEVTIEIIKPIWNDLKNKAILKQSELVLPRSSKTHYSLRGQIPDVNQKAIFALKFDPKTKKLKHFFYDWYITKIQYRATQYYIAGKYSKAEQQYISSEEVILGIKILRNSFHKIEELFPERAPVNSKVTLKAIEQAKESNNAVKIWIDDIEAYNAALTE